MKSTVPSYAHRFAAALRTVSVASIEIPTSPSLCARHGILTTTRLQYAEGSFQLLGRALEYRVGLPGREDLEVSLQLYRNDHGHWRLFAYCPRGMLLSVNLTLVREARGILALEQRLVIPARTLTPDARAKALGRLAAALRGAELEVTESGRVSFGTFDVPAGKFIDTTPRRFVADFVRAAVIKGHFMTNKGYTLAGLPRASVPSGTKDSASSRGVPAGLRYRVLERDGGCVACGAKVVDGARLHVDHIEPWSSGGATTLENLQALCERCNVGKGNRSTHRFPRRR